VHGSGSGDGHAWEVQGGWVGWREVRGLWCQCMDQMLLVSAKSTRKVEWVVRLLA
jgi:hypothetical protein